MCPGELKPRYITADALLAHHRPDPHYRFTSSEAHVLADRVEELERENKRLRERANASQDDPVADGYLSRPEQHERT